MALKVATLRLGICLWAALMSGIMLFQMSSTWHSSVESPSTPLGLDTGMALLQARSGLSKVNATQSDTQTMDGILQAEILGSGDESTALSTLPRGNESTALSTLALLPESLVSLVNKFVFIIPPNQHVEDYEASLSKKAKLPSAKDILVAGTGFLVFYAIIAFLWRKLESRQPTEPVVQEEQTEFHGFQYGLFDTKNCSMGLVCASCCCLSIMWPTTASSHKLKLIDFWPAFFVMNILLAYNGIAGGALGLAAVIVAVWFRQNIRSHYGLDHKTSMTVLEDCLTWCCCCFCAAAQEWRQLEYVQAKRHAAGPSSALSHA